MHGQPVAGVRVSASWPEPGETLSELFCLPEALRELSSGASTLLDCFGPAVPLVIELAGAWQGEAPIHAEAATAADGTFTLEGLTEGPLALWALGEQGAVMRSGIPAGTEGVELKLEGGDILKGTVQGDGAPLAGVRVLAIALRHTRFFATTTDADGNYELGPLPRDTYALLFTQEGWLPDLRLYRRKFDEVTLQRPRTLTGRVLSASGAPVPGIRVEVHEGPDTLLPGTAYREVTADTRGDFTLVLPSGQYMLTAEREGQSALAHVELGTQAAPEVVLELGSALQVRGQVLDEARQPVAGAKIEVRRANRDTLFREAVTDAAGRYSVGPLEPGNWRFRVEALRYYDFNEPHTLTADMGPLDFTLEHAPTVEGLVTGTDGRPLPGLVVSLHRPGTKEPIYEASTGTDEEGRFVLEASEPADLLVSLEDRYRMEPVRVRAPARDVHLRPRPGASVTGTVVDARGRPLEGFAVTLALEQQAPDYDSDCDTTDASGRFALRDFKPGAYILLAFQPGDSVERRVWRPVELREEAPLEVELRLPEERTLSGVVVDGQGRPLPGAYVQAELAPEDRPEWLHYGGGCGLESRFGVRVDEEGRFTLHGLTAPRYKLESWAYGHDLSPKRSEGGHPLSVGLRVDTGAVGVRLVMERRPHITGRLVGPDGAPVSRFRLNNSGYQSADGSFSVPFLQHLPPERLEFTARGMATRNLLVARREGADVDLGEVRMEPSRTLRGRVLDARTSQPVPQAAVRIGPVDEAPRSGESIVWLVFGVEEDGTFEVEALAPRPYTVQVSHAPGYQPLSMRVEAEQNEVTLLLEPAASP
jgi:protocatechuate 3,4-dioxygenase beta subunit